MVGQLWLMVGMWRKKENLQLGEFIEFYFFFLKRSSFIKNGKRFSIHWICFLLTTKFFFIKTNLVFQVIVIIYN